MRAWKRWIWIPALLLLAAALVFFNLPEWKAEEPAVGAAPGELAPDFSLTCLDGSTFRLSETRGRVTVLNLWATWCGPCVKELPAFDRLQQERPDTVSVLAIHSDLVTEDVEAWLADYDYSLAFAVDETGSVISALGGTAALPQTIILDASGRVTYNQVGSMTYEKLAALAAEAAGENNER